VVLDIILGDDIVTTLKQQTDAVERITINQRGYINVLRGLLKKRRRPCTQSPPAL